MKKLLCYSFTALLLFWAGTVWGKQIPPKSSTLVNDYAGVMAANEVEMLERKLVAYYDSTSTQIAIVIESSLEEEDVFEYSLRIAENWGIGDKDKDNGILVFVAIEDRKLFIHTGTGVQDYLTDNVSKRIIDNIIKPAFKAGDYYGGLDRATSAMIDLGAGKFINDSDKDSEGSSGWSWIILLVVFFGVLLLFSMLSRISSDDGPGGGYYRGGHYDHRRGGSGGWIFFPGTGSSWGSGSSDSDWGGGGFDGFGGGGFDGGGAGGDW